MKRIRFIIIIIVMTLSLSFSSVGLAKTAIEQGDFVFSQNYVGKLVLDEYKGYGVSVSIPGEVMGVQLDTIGSNAFEYEYSLREVSIPSGVTTIEYWAFYSCRNLEKVYVPPSVFSIDYSAFRSCPRLVLYGTAGSYVERYARLHSLPFVAVNLVPTPPPEAPLSGSFPLVFSDASAELDTSGSYPSISIPMENISSSLIVDRFTLAFYAEDEAGNIIPHSATGNLAMLIDFTTNLLPGGTVMTGGVTLEGYDQVKHINAGIAGVHCTDGSQVQVPASSIEYFYWTIDSPLEPTVEPTIVPTATSTSSLTPTVAPTAEPTPIPGLKGDADNDRDVDINDLTALIDHIVAKVEPASLANADTNSDGTVDMADVLWIINSVLVN